MRPRNARQLALALLVAASMGVSGAAAAGQATASSKLHTVKHRSKTRHTRVSSRQRGQKAPTPDRISEIQAALAKNGSFSGVPNGKWDASTVDAMKKFQDANGLNPTGKLDAKTLQKLGLGSQTAGIAPPTPPISSSALTPSQAPAVPRQL